MYVYIFQQWSLTSTIRIELGGKQGLNLLTWINFNPNMDN